MAAPALCESLGQRATLRKSRIRPSPYDSHPPMHARIRALGGEPAHAAAPDPGKRALELLGDVEAAELELLPFVCGERLARRLEPLRWEDGGMRVLVPAWEEFCEVHAGALRALRVAELPALLADLPGVAARWGLRRGRHGTGPDLAGIVLWRAFALQLIRQGWQLVALPGEELELRRGEARLQPLQLCRALASGGAADESWRAFCAESGFGELRLWPEPPAPD
jgi:hypothetical protein